MARRRASQIIAPPQTLADWNCSRQGAVRAHEYNTRRSTWRTPQRMLTGSCTASYRTQKQPSQLRQYSDNMEHTGRAAAHRCASRPRILSDALQRRVRDTAAVAITGSSIRPSAAIRANPNSGVHTLHAQPPQATLYERHERCGSPLTPPHSRRTEAALTCRVGERHSP